MAIAAKKKHKPPGRVTERVTPHAKLVNGKFHFNVSGSVRIPAGLGCPPGTKNKPYCVNPATICQGRVLIRFKYGDKTVVSRHAKLAPGDANSCSYKAGIDISKHHLRTFKASGRVPMTVLVSFSGNSLLGASHSRAEQVSAG